MTDCKSSDTSCNEGISSAQTVSDWRQPPENTLPSLIHGISNSDGIELDLRLTLDGELIIHHDAKVSVNKAEIGKHNPYVESWSLDELREFGFCTFKEMISNKTILSNWRDEGKMVCLELKRPHPKSPLGGGYFGGRTVTKLLSKMMVNASSILEEFEIPKSNTVFYAFHNNMHESVKLSGSQYRWAELLPVVPRFGHSRLKRMMAYPQYLITPFGKLINKHRTRGASMVPCALEYFQPFYNRLLIGKSVGLSGKRLKYFQTCRTGMPVYVWPAKENYESRLLESGITGLTDNLNPDFTWYKEGKARWKYPATQPLDESQLQLLNGATFDNHQDILQQLSVEVPKWSECDTQRKLKIIKMWQAKWNWELKPGEMKDDSISSPPWQSVRLIGHRGSGKTSRPIMK